MIIQNKFVERFHVYFCLFFLWTSLPASVFGDGLTATQQFVVDVENLSISIPSEMQLVDAYKKHGSSSLSNDGGGQVEYTLDVAIAQDGYYQVYAWWPQSHTLSSDPKAKYQLSTLHKHWVVTKDQSNSSSGQWVLLGEFAFFGSDQITLSVSGKYNAPFFVDAFRFVYTGSTSSPTKIEIAGLPVAVEGESYKFKIPTSGASALGSTWGVASYLPDGLHLDVATGVIGGIPTEPGIYEPEVYLVTPTGYSTTHKFSLVVVPSKGSKSKRRAKRLIDDSLSKFAGIESVAETALAVTSLLDEVASMPEGGWLKVNQNLFSDVWTPADLRPLNLSSNPAPDRIIIAWSSFAWDSNNGDLIIYGGGHANYSGNDVYIWRGKTRLWERASLPSEITQDDFGNWRAIDDAFAAPSSAHTYDNSVYLPLSRRFMTYGGADYNNGGPYLFQADATTVRSTGPYVFDPALANANQVGGTTGSHVQRVAPFPEITGGNMWTNRDMNALNPVPSQIPIMFVNGTTSVTIEGGQEIIYLTAVSGGTAQQLYKHTIVDINDPSQDIWEQVGLYWGGFGDQGAGAYSPASKVYVRTSGEVFTYWSLELPLSDNKNEIFIPLDTSGSFITSRNYGLDFYPLTNAFYLWDGGTEVWRLEPPTTISPNGWTINAENAAALPAPNGDFATGILGKWEFAADLNAFVGLQDAQEGNIWIYKPRGWAAPIPSNQLPTVTIVTPVNGDNFAIGDTVLIAADASDSDGSIDLVEFYQGSTKLGEDNTAPYSYEWASIPAGTFTLSARAYDDMGANYTSSTVVINVIDPNLHPLTELTAPLDGDIFYESDTVLFTADAFDSDGTVILVEFFAGTTKIAEDSVAPYIFNWVNPPPGSYQLTTQATDNSSASTTSSIVNIEVLSDNLPPSVTLTNPQDGESFVSGDTIVLIADAFDSDGSIVQVEFFEGANKLGEATTAPFTFDWLNAPLGSHTLTAVAMDNESANTTSSTVTVDVIHPDGTSIVTLQDGVNDYNGTQDTYLSGWHKNNNFGAISELKDQSELFVKLVQFAIFESEGGPVPDDAIIESAVLSLYKFTAYDHQYQLHRLLNPWAELSANWNESQPGIPWTQPGASGIGTDYETAAASSGAVAWSPGWLEMDITMSVQAMSFGTANHGWRLNAISGNGNLKRFYSREMAADVALRPKLILRYTFGGNLPPSVTLTSPNEGDNFFEGSPIELTADAADIDGTIDRIEFFVGPVLLAADDDVPYSFTWIDPPVGTHQLVARAFDDSGAGVTSTLVNIEILSDNLPPSVTLTNPQDGDSFVSGDTIVLIADAFDSDGSIVQVEFFEGANKLGEATTAPFTFDWLDVPLGSHTLTAVAMDNEGANTTSSAVTVDVTHPDGTSVLALQNGVNDYNGTQDTYLSGWHKNNNFGAISELKDQSELYVKLVKFAIFESEGGPVPDGAIIESAVLSLYKFTAYDHQYQLHRLLNPWAEFSASWNESQPSIPWTQPGASGIGTDYETVSASIGAIDWFPGWLEMDVTMSVQAMSFGTANHGWRLNAISGNGNLKRFYSREMAADVALRPKLILRYTFGGNLPPSVTLTSPNEGNNFFEGSPIELTADAADIDGTIDRIEFFLGPVLLGTDDDVPYSFTWIDPAVGTHQLVAQAFDDSGAGVTSTLVNIEVLSDNVPPSVTLTNPQDGESFVSGDTIVLIADAFDSNGSIVQVEFFEGANKLGEATTAPFTFDWLNAPLGSHTLTAVAMDNESANTTSSTVTVDVIHPDGTSIVSLQDGVNDYNGTQDTYLSGWHKNNNFGAISELKDQSELYVKLVKFAIFESEGGPVPDGAIIESAVLSLYKFTAYDHQYQLHRLLNPWAELSTNWNESQPGIPWTQPGASGIGTDYETAAASSGAITWSPGWLEMDVTMSVQAMSFGTANHGWRLNAISGNDNLKRFYSKESTVDLNLRPKLRITYH